MSWLASLLIAFLLAVGGTLLGGFLATRAVRWLKVSGREGYSGYWTVFMALLAGLYSLVSGLLMARYAGIADGFLAFAAAAGVAFGGIGLVALLAWLGADRAPTQGGKELVYELEIRTPPGGPTLEPASGKFYAYLSAAGAGMSAAALDFAAQRQEAERWLLPGSVRLQTRRPGPYIAIGGERLHGATVYFRLEPAVTEAWSGWLKGSPAGEQPGSDAGSFELRVRRRAEPPAGG